MSLFDDLAKHITPETIAAIAGGLGQKADEGKTQSALSAALPVLIGALAKNSSKEEGAKALDTALEKDHDGSVLDDVGSFVSGALSGEGPGAGILKHVLGAKRPEVEDKVAKKSGIDAADVSKILVTVAPLILGALGKKKKEEGLDAKAVAQKLAADKEVAKEKVDEPSFFESFFDTDKDGDVGVDDIAKTAAPVLGALFGGKK